MTGFAVAAGCGTQATEPYAGPSALPPSVIGQQSYALAGKDGAGNIILPNQTVNRYARVTANIRPGDKTIQVMGLAAFNVAVDDLLMIMQMQGATLDFTDTINYGTVTNYNGAGVYEFVTVTGVDLATGTISVAACKGGIRNAYSAAAHTQVVRVPQYSTLTVGAAGSIVAPAWDGNVGGIVAVHAQTSVTLNGSINVSGRGFRPGLLDNVTTAPGQSMPIFRGPDPAVGGEKGEGIGGYSADYDNSGGRYGRGAPGNGGGGGNSHNAGGGGGANASNGAPWRRGQGVMDSNATGAAAWSLDPGYIGNGNKLTTDGGGGRGGYTFGASNQDALTLGPNQATWGGDSRREVGGLGGRPLDPGVTQRLFFGGGGGAGDGNNDAANQGGAGGGLVFVATPTVSGNGSILASGENAPPTRGGNNDAPGGGGGGGTIVVAAQALSGITATANGGSGGTQLTLVNESEGPGGGGGGGFIAVAGGTITTSATGGKSGLSQSTAVTEFPVNGATDGNSGNSKASAMRLLPLIPALDCSASMADLAVSITDNLNGGPATPGGNVKYTVTYQNLSNTTPVFAASIADSIPPAIPPQNVSWTCTAQGGAVCPAASGTGSIPPTQVDFPAGSSVTFVVDVPVPAGRTGLFTYQASIQAPLDINDPMLGNNIATDSSRLPTADLSVIVTDNLQSKNAQPGSPVQYTVTVSNLGNLAVANGVIADTLTPGVTIASWTCTPSGNATCPAASGTGPIATTALKLAPGDTVVYTVNTVAIPDNTLTALVYRVAAQPPVGQMDANLADNVGISSHAVDNSNIPATASDLALKITHTPQKLLPGQDVTYTAQVTNNGTTPVVNANVVFSVPVGSIIKTPASGTGWVCTQAGVIATCVAPTLAPGNAAPITVVITDPSVPAAGGTPVARGTVSASRNNDPNPANNTSIDAGTLPQADLSLTIDRSPQQPQPGDEVTYTLTASNIGPDSAPTPTVVFTVPPGGTVTQPAAGSGWTCTQQGDTFTCTRPDLPQGTAPPITVKVMLPAGTTGGTPALVGQVGSPGVDDPNLVNNRAVSDAGTAPRTQADLAITLSRSPATSQPGQIVTYTAIATNLGTDTVNSPTVTFQLPPGSIVVQPAQGSGWVCQQAGDTVTCVRSSLTVGPAPPITVQLLTPLEPTANPGVNPGTLAATVSAVRNNDPNPANDSAVIGVGALPPTNTDLSVTLTRSPETPKVGENETITVQVTDKGQDPAYGVAVSIQVPPDTVVVQPAQGDGWRCIPNGQAYLCTRDRLDVGPAPPITLIVVTPDAATGDAVPQLGASVTAGSAQDPTPPDNSARIPIGPDIQFRLSGGGFSCTMGASGPALPVAQLAFGALLTLLVRRRRRP
jgi:uncharacterized repeat protein (TIGR01451 family)